MSTHAALLPRYRQLRQTGLELNNRLVKGLSKGAMNEGGRRLGVLEDGTLFLDTDDALSVVMDYCIHDVRRHGLNTVDVFLRDAPPPVGSDERVLLDALRASRFSVFAVEAVERGVGVQVRDLLRDTTAFMVDVGFGTSARAGAVLAFRFMTADGIGMTTGAALPLGKLSKADRTELAADIRATFDGFDFNNLAPEEASDFAAGVLRTCLAEGAAEGIAYLPVNDELPPRRPRGKKNKR